MDPAIGEAGDIDTSLAVLTFKNGVVVTVDNSRKATYGYDQRVEIFGSKVRDVVDVYAITVRIREALTCSPHYNFSIFNYW